MCICIYVEREKPFHYFGCSIYSSLLLLAFLYSLFFPLFLLYWQKTLVHLLDILVLSIVPCLDLFWTSQVIVRILYLHVESFPILQDRTLYLKLIPLPSSHHCSSYQGSYCLPTYLISMGSQIWTFICRFDFFHIEILPLELRVCE